MITPFLFWVFAGIGVILSGYAFLDNENRVFGHIFASGIATIIFFLLGVTLMGGGVGEEFPVSINETTVNNTTSFVYDTTTVTMQDTGMAWLFVFFGVVMLVVTIMACLEIVNEVVYGQGLTEGFDEE